MNRLQLCVVLLMSGHAALTGTLAEAQLFACDAVYMWRQWCR